MGIAHIDVLLVSHLPCRFDYKIIAFVSLKFTCCAKEVECLDDIGGH